MSLAERLQAGPTVTFYGLPCPVATLLAGLDEVERDALVAILADRSWTARNIAAALADEGLPAIQQQSLNRHRRGDCRCGRTDEPR